MSLEHAREALPGGAVIGIATLAAGFRIARHHEGRVYAETGDGAGLHEVGRARAFDRSLCADWGGVTRGRFAWCFEAPMPATPVWSAKGTGGVFRIGPVADGAVAILPTQTRRAG